MKLQKNIMVPVVLGALSTLAVNANAGGTPAGTAINNEATLTYSVNSVPQTGIKSPADSFVVDIKVDFKAERTKSAVLTTSLAEDDVVVAAFNITNEGNAPASFSLKAADAAPGESLYSLTDNKNLTTPAYTFYADNNSNGVFDTGDTAITDTSDINADSTAHFLAVVNKGQVIGVDEDVIITTVSVSGKTATVNSSLVSLDTDGSNTSQEDDRGEANTAADVQVVYADGVATGSLGDNLETINDALQLIFPDMGGDDDGDGVDDSGNLVKTSTIISDPFNGTVNPKAIPGAVVEYTITVKNSGSAPAENVTITDTIPATTAFIAGSVKIDFGDGTLVDGTSATTQSGQELSFNLGTLNAAAGTADDETNVIKFQVTIQ